MNKKGAYEMKKILFILCVLTTILTIQVSINTKESIIIYSSLELFRGEELQKQLNEQFPQYDVRVMYVPTAKAAAKISVEKIDSDADIVVGLETSYMDKIKDSLEDIKGFSNLLFLDGLKPDDNDNLFVTWERQAGSFIIDKNILAEYDLPIPTSYDDLLSDQYKNLIAMPDPKSSGTGYFFYKNLVNTRGEEAALEYIDALTKNVKQFTESGSGPMKLLKQGEIAIGLGLTFQAVNEINNGSDFTIIYPKEGSPYSLTGTGMIKGRKNKKGIKEIFTFIVNDFLVFDKENFSPEQILVVQENKIDNYPQNIPYADMHGISDMKEKAKLLNIWKY